MSDIQQIAQTIVQKRGDIPASRSMLVAISGIDASGKGYTTNQLALELQKRGVNAVAIGVDGWLNLPNKRFSDDKPAECFYYHGFRFDEMFEQLIVPLKNNRSIRLEADYTEETATAYRRHVYEFENVDVILLEGVFILSRAYRHHYDYKVWVDCSFDTAIERAVSRGQEGLPPEETIAAFRRIYLPAQEIHFGLEDPKGAADAVLANDPRLAQ